MNKEFLHMQKLAGIITEGEYKEKVSEMKFMMERLESPRMTDTEYQKKKNTLKEDVNTNLELKSLAKKIYLKLEGLGAQVELTTSVGDPKEAFFKHVGNINYGSPFVMINVNDRVDFLHILVASPSQNMFYTLWDGLNKSFPEFDFTNEKVEEGPGFGGKGYIMNSIMVKPKTTGRKGGLAAT